MDDVDTPQGEEQNIQLRSSSAPNSLHVNVISTFYNNISSVSSNYDAKSDLFEPQHNELGLRSAKLMTNQSNRSSKEINTFRDDGPSPRGVDLLNDAQLKYNVDVDDDIEKCGDISSVSEYSFDSDSDNDDENGFRGTGLVRNFDINLLRDSIKDGEHILNRVLEKDVVLVVGKTGTGKSTFIQGISGRRMQVAIHTTTSPIDGKVVEKEVFEVVDGLLGSEIGHVKASMTKHINCYVPQHAKIGEEVVYIDTPGFEDTHGQEVDIATSVMLNQVAKKCRSLRFVILVNYVSLLEDRGNAIKSILKLTRNFVDDFDKNKQSFMFLFTHTDEVREIPSNCMDGAKKCLEGEIIRSAEGSRDEDIQQILSFMQKSLKKKYPFVQIFHPMQSNFQAFSISIRDKLKKADPSFLARNCGLTVASQLVIGGELEILLRRLRIEIEKSDITQVIDILNTLQYLRLYINTEDVCRVASESMDELAKFIEDQRKCIEEEICRGTGSEHEFSDGNVATLQKAISKLRALHAFEDTQTCVTYSIDVLLQQKLDRFLAKFLSIDCSSSFVGLHHQLRKLKAWSKGFPKFNLMYEEAIHHVTMIIQQIVTKTSSFDTTQIEMMPREHLTMFIHNLHILKSIYDDCDKLAIYKFDTTCAIDAYHIGLEGIVSILKIWNENAVESMITNGTKESTVERFTTQACLLEILHNNMEERSVFLQLLKQIKIVRVRVRDGAIAYFESLCSDAQVQSFQEHLDFNNRLSHIRFIYDRLSSIGHSWDMVHTIYAAMLEHIKAILKNRSGELNEMSESSKQHGIRDGKREAHALELFQTYQCFDTFLAPQDQFVGNCLIKYKEKYKERIKYVLQNEAKIFTELDGCCHVSSLSAIRFLKTIFPELLEVTSFASIICDTEVDISLVKSNAKSRLNQYIDRFAKETKEYLGKWKNTVESREEQADIYTATEHLNDMLDILSSLRNIDSTCGSTLDCIYTEVCGVLNEFTNISREIINSCDFDYTSKFNALNAVSQMGEFTHTKPLLPSFSLLKEHARNYVSKRAEEIEQIVSETSEFDKIEKYIEQFEGATLLDQFTSNEATSRLGPLRKLSEQKEVQVDELLNTWIKEEKFDGMCEFLSPYAQSKDQLKRQKFVHFQSLICESLQKRIDSLHQLIFSKICKHTSRMLANGLNTLSQAERGLKKYIDSNNCDLVLKNEIDSLRKQINVKLSRLLSQVSSMIEKHEYTELVTLQKEISVLCKSVKKYIYPVNCKKIKEVNIKYHEAIDSVSSYADRFFTSSFRDSALLLVVLCSLKNASTAKDPNHSVLIDLYHKTTVSLTEKINDALESISECVSQTQCFDDAVAILTALDRQLESGFKEHLNEAIVSKSKFQLEEWKEERRKYNCSMEYNEENVVIVIKKWAKALDRCDPSRFSIVLKKWFSGTDYNNLRTKLIENILSRFQCGKSAINCRDYASLHDCINILELMSQELARHVDLAPKLLRELEEEALAGFKCLCKHLQKALKHKSRVQVQALYHDYCGFVISVPCVMASDSGKGLYTQTNQLIYENLNQHITELEELVRSFEFLKIKFKLEYLQGFGSFMADKCLQFYEEVCGCDHIEVDTWLEKLWKLCLEHFLIGYDPIILKHCATLGVSPLASAKEINNAFRKKSLKHHPDKCSNQNGSSDLFRQAKESRDFLLNNVNMSKTSSALPFGSLLNRIDFLLHDNIRECLKLQQYKSIERILFQLGNLHVLENLTQPPLDCENMRGKISALVKNHVEKVRIEVDSNWSERKYRVLNDNIADLKLMEDNFKSYPNIFSSSWNNGIVQNIKEEIESLGRQVRDYINDKDTALRYIDDFRRCFIAMGCVMIELPFFKAFTKSIMCTILESCLTSGWGYSYLFDLGLRLQRGNEHDSAEESHVAQVIVSQFSHFKEVMTMVWNEETSQKPVEDTVCGIEGHIITGSAMKPLMFDRCRLIESYKVFDARYKILLGEYIHPDADLDHLVNRITAAAKKLKPISCQCGWNADVRQEIPNILAGIFAVFTILKSGTSYNRLIEGVANANLGQKVLMKPHNIQVLTLLRMLGCDAHSDNDLESQLLQIRTGEGKSMILGAAAVILALLGFKVRCVCYSEYLSCRDYNLFAGVFRSFQLTEFIEYSKITTLSEDSIAEKGNIRKLTDDLLHGESGKITLQKDSKAIPRPLCRSEYNYDKKGTASNKSMTTSDYACTISGRIPCKREEILLVDEVDVFFGSEFYGRTYNQVVQLQESEISSILKHIWTTNKCRGCRLYLSEIQKNPAYSRLQQKLPNYTFLLDNEISLMLDEVTKVDDAPYYYLDQETDRIGYKVMDTISYDVTYGYHTIFAYLKEADEGNLRWKEKTLANVLTMPVSCGQFSYANISPARILGVSGTLDAMGTYEKDILNKYGVNKLIYMPSVYGESSFQFDKAGNGIFIDSTLSNHFHTITDQIKTVSQQKRAAIVFFHDEVRLKEYTNSAFYQKLGRQKRLLIEEMSTTEKEYVINKAATAGQITICSAVFGRGTDFFCKDGRVQNNGGVHVIQTFFSAERSEEVQIQGRTARQGKRGSYQMLLLESDLEHKFRVPCGQKDNYAKSDHYNWLCTFRDKCQDEKRCAMEKNLSRATIKDQATHRYFNALLSKDQSAKDLFQDIYFSAKKRDMSLTMDLDLAFVVDISGSMGPYANTTIDLVQGLVKGEHSIMAKLQSRLPEISFKLRLAILGFRDIDDKENQFEESVWQGSHHFTDDVDDAIQFVESLSTQTSGGGDIAEDILGAIDRCVSWNSQDDWTSRLKFIMTLTDAPAHGMVHMESMLHQDSDSYPAGHPLGLTAETVVESLVANDIDLFMCSYNPSATSKTEDILSTLHTNHPHNIEKRDIIKFPMMKQAVKGDRTYLAEGRSRHIIFALDESGSMSHHWEGVVVAYNQYLTTQKLNQNDSNLISVVQFNKTSRVTVNKKLLSQAPCNLDYASGGTAFAPPARDVKRLACATPLSHKPVVIFMSDGCSKDAEIAANIFASVNDEVQQKWNNNVELHVIAFGSNASRSQLELIAGVSQNSQVFSSASTLELSKIFVSLAGCQNVSEVLESEICNRVSDAVSNKLLMEYQS